MTNEFIEYTIKIKDESHSLSEKELSHVPITLSKDTLELAQKVDALAKRFFDISESSEAPSIEIKFKMVWQ